jgi:hypothetical protein
MISWIIAAVLAFTGWCIYEFLIKSSKECWKCYVCNEEFGNRAGYVAHINRNEEEHEDEKIEYVSVEKERAANVIDRVIKENQETFDELAKRDTRTDLSKETEDKR